MNTIRHSRVRSAVIVALVLFSWLFASSHCAIVDLLASAGAGSDHSCCHQEDAPLPAQTMQCCKALHMPLPAAQTAAPEGSFHALQQPLWVESQINFRYTDPRLMPFTAAYAVGPPGESFSTLVLKRSLQSHAPPLFIA